MTIKAMKQALEALEEAVHYTSAPVWSPSMTKECNEAITALRQALSEAQLSVNENSHAIEQAEKQEPVAWRAPNWGHSADEWVYRDADDPVLGLDGKPTPNNEPLYTAPQPQREWVGLTFEEILETYRGPDGSDYVDYARAIGAKLKEKNT